MMDYLKTEAPFWKSEETADGKTEWVSARDSDTKARSRWRND
jgi:molybdopterin synthase catalytic subunit